MRTEKELQALTSRVEAIEGEGAGWVKELGGKIDKLRSETLELHQIKTNGGPPREMREVVKELWLATEKLRLSRQFSTAAWKWVGSRPLLNRILSTRAGVSILTLTVVWGILAFLDYLGFKVDPWAIVKALFQIK